MTAWWSQAVGTERPEPAIAGPCLRILGPVDVVGAAGELPGRSRGQALEMMAWLLWHPGATATEMTAGLSIAEGTRRATLSRLRGWLGAGPDGEPYVPAAYSGRVRLHTAVTSDWHQLCALVGRDPAAAHTDALHAAYRLVRGPVLRGTPPGRWAWAGGLRADACEFVATISDVLQARTTTRVRTPGLIALSLPVRDQQPPSHGHGSFVPARASPCESRPCQAREAAHMPRPVIR